MRLSMRILLSEIRVKRELTFPQLNDLLAFQELLELAEPVLSSMVRVPVKLSPYINNCHLGVEVNSLARLEEDWKPLINAVLLKLITMGVRNEMLLNRDAREMNEERINKRIEKLFPSPQMYYLFSLADQIRVREVSLKLISSHVIELPYFADYHTPEDCIVEAPDLDFDRKKEARMQMLSWYVR